MKIYAVSAVYGRWSDMRLIHQMCLAHSKEEAIGYLVSDFLTKYPVEKGWHLVAGPLASEARDEWMKIGTGQVLVPARAEGEDHA